MSRRNRADRVRLPAAVGPLLAMGILVAFPAPTLAGVESSAASQGGADQIAQIIADIALAFVRLLIGSGAAVFVVGVARGAFDGVLASALGRPGAVSVGLLRLVGIVGAFLLLLVSFGLSRAFVDLLITQFVNSGALATPIPGAQAVYVPQSASGLRHLAVVIGEALRLVLFLIGAWFMVHPLLLLELPSIVKDGEEGIGFVGIAIHAIIGHSCTSCCLRARGSNLPATRIAGGAALAYNHLNGADRGFWFAS